MCVNNDEANDVSSIQRKKKHRAAIETDNMLLKAT